MPVGLESTVKAKQKCPRVEKIRADGDNSQARSTDTGQKQSMG